MIHNIIKKGWKTSILGIIIIIAGIASSLFKSVSWADSLIPLAVGILLLFVPDKVIDIFLAFMGGSKKSDQNENTDSEQRT